MKVCIKPVFEDKNKTTVYILSSVHFTKEIYCYFQLLQGGSALVWLCLRLYIVFKHVNLWNFKDSNDILLQGDYTSRGLDLQRIKNKCFLNVDEIPRQVNLFGVSVELDFTQNKFWMLFGNQKDHSYLINCITVGDISCNGKIFLLLVYV